MKFDKKDKSLLLIDNKKLLQRLKTFYICISFIKMIIVGNVKNQTLKDILKPPTINLAKLNL